jgi:hypothetical protein
MRKSYQVKVFLQRTAGGKSLLFEGLKVGPLLRAIIHFLEALYFSLNANSCRMLYLAKNKAL